MLLTEEEAKTKLCPLVREDFLSGPPFNGKPLCVGSACMAWRESEETFPGGKHKCVVCDGTGSSHGTAVGTCHACWGTGGIEKLKRGYCGLAGKAEP